MSTAIDQNNVNTTNVSAATLTVTGNANIATQLHPYVAKGVNYPAVLTDEIVELTATGLTLTLPTPVGCAGKTFEIILNAAGTGTVATAAGLINGAATYTLTAQYKFVRVFSNGTDWLIIGSN